MIPLLIVLFGFLLASCESSKPSTSTTRQIIRESYDLGEYLQTDENEHIYTFSRRSKNSASDAPEGLVRISPSTERLEVLDSEAGEGRELIREGKALFYRVGDRIRIFNNGKIVELPLGVLHLRDVAKRGTHYWLSLQDLNERNLILVITETGTEIFQHPLDGPLYRFLTVNDRIWGLIQDPRDGFLLTDLEGGPAFRFGETLRGNYVETIEIDSRIFISFLDESEGTLKLIHFYSSDINTKRSIPLSFEIETVDGIPGETYRGMDVAFFKDGSYPGLIYLDAWELKLRIARKLGNHWKSQELPLKGAVGFYTQVIEQNGNEIRIAFHNFRTHHADGRQSFEDLEIYTLNLDDY